MVQQRGRREGGQQRGMDMCVETFTLGISDFIVILVDAGIRRKRTRQFSV